MSMHEDRAVAHRWNGTPITAGTPHPAAGGDRWNATGAAIDIPPNGVAPPTRTSSTDLEYYCRYLGLRDRAVREGIKEEDHRGFVTWLIGRKSEMAAAYWRKVKAAALAGLDREGAKSARDAELLLQAETSAGTSRRPSRAPRAKAISAEDYELLLHALTDRIPRSRNIALVTLMWMMAGRAVGLRPCEWARASLTTDELGRPILVVINAKSTNGRSHGPSRTLGLWNLWPSELAAISVLLQEVNRVGPAGFGRLHRTCADLLYIVNRRLWPTRREIIGLYSCRHQLSADAKALLRPIEVAALMGHRTTRTAFLHYAQRSCAELRTGPHGEAALPVPSADDASRVIEHRHSRPPGRSSPGTTAAAAAADQRARPSEA